MKRIITIGLDGPPEAVKAWVEYLVDELIYHLDNKHNEVTDVEVVYGIDIKEGECKS